MNAALPRFTSLQAPADWETVDFISDLHLQASEPLTFRTFQTYLETTESDAVFILGDLFEVWIGDDAAALPGFEQECAATLALAASLRPVYFMAGNRDFLLGRDYLAASGMLGLDDPTVLAFAQHRWLLTHGDALCLDDVTYQQFRAVVRDPGQQQTFLARSLPERLGLARAIRAQSEARKKAGQMEGAGDVDTGEAIRWLQAAGATTMIHGHTHRPADHALEAPGATRFRRVVLSDWDGQAVPPRAQVLRLTARGHQRIDL
ncbi:MAG: UDP-2,3-diacylglucosamine diphosphatase [Burkholderiaceae bacterium]|nr:UDP-2,3-diacylglucosamine diphosphatase [Burkholderiaceae bacterium]